MKSYKLVNSALIEVEDPTNDPSVDDADVAIAKAGYRSVINTKTDHGVGADVSLYQREEVPRYYVDLMGAHMGIATLVADDFPALLATLKEIHPLLTLMGLDQAHTLHVLDDINQEKRARR